ncbi:MAG: CotH kinase family protein [Candidatus Marinimicrobia bacterium]|nr:CotH kinase family protein [Candidatus Neomarinimicrobiota bacterium]
MKKNSFYLIILMFTSLLFAQNSDLVYRSNTISEIRITIDTTVLAWIYDDENVESDSLHPVSVTFHNENLDVSLDNVGFRLRGNTSRHSLKKSFKLDFNEFIKGQDIEGIQKFNLKGEQNDPSLIRSKFAFELFEKIGLIASRVAYTTMFINDNYMGLYENIEHIDDCFLTYHIGDDSGNLWKCLWPADLNYRGSDPSDYYPYFGDERPYELKTNKDEYDFSDLAHLIDVINNTPSAYIKDSLESVFRVTDLIKYLAVNIMTGSWDDYRYLKNNYYLYHDPVSNKFHFIPYDYDNTFGIDWVEGGNWGDPNWARINMYSYVVNDDDGRPLSDIIFNDDEYRNLFTHFIEFYTRHVFREDQWTGYGDSIKVEIRPYVVNDPYYPLDHGFTMADFDNSYNTDYRNGHVERGLYEFMRKRAEQTLMDLDWRSSVKPSIYDIDVIRNGREAILNAAVFSNEGIDSVMLVTFDAFETPLETLPFALNRIPGTFLVEEFDRWTVEAILDGNELLYQIVAKDSLGVQSIWPRSGYASFKQLGSSDLAVYINEFMASNDTSFADQDGDHDDWLELYNASGETVYLGGMYLTDKPDNITKWRIPDGTEIDPGNWLLFWCDEDEEQIGLHTNFKLSGGGEFIALTEADGLSIVDSLSFGEQETDISYGRTADAGAVWQFFASPTPGYSNLRTNILAVPETIMLFHNYPNPFNPLTTISYQLSSESHVDLSIYDIKGKKIETLANGSREWGVYDVAWNAGRHASGLYLAVLEVNGELIATQKMLLMK